MKRLLFVALLVVCHQLLQAQYYEILIHTDLPITQAENSAYKIARDYLYNNTLSSVKDHRQDVSLYSAGIEEVQRNIFNSLSNVSDGIKNGKALYYVAQRIPKIYTNLSTATSLAVGKPYLITIATSTVTIMIARITNLENYIQNFIAKSDDQTLITPTDRDKFVREVRNEVNILYTLSSSLVSNFKMYNLQDAINKVVPYKVFINMDKNIVTDLKTTFKF